MAQIPGKYTSTCWTKQKTALRQWAYSSCVSCFTVVLLVRRSERCNEISTFFSSVRLSLPTLACTFSTDYVRLACDLLRNWELYSDAEKAILIKRLFTVLSENGINMSLDFTHEKYNFSNRQPTGKRNTPGTLARVEHSCLNRIDHINKGNVTQTSSRLRDGHYTMITSNERLITIDPVAFAHIRLQLFTSKIFCSEEKPVREPDDTKLYSPISGQPLPGVLLKSDSKGCERVKNYVLRFYINTQNQVHRSEKDMGLHAIETTTQKIAEAEKKRVTRATSRSSADLNKSGIKQEIFEELQKLCLYLLPQDQGSIPKSVHSTSKAVMVGTLVRLRRKAFSQNPGLEKRLEEEAKSSSDLVTSRALREEELDSQKFFSFAECPALNDPRFVRVAFSNSF